MLWSKKLCYNSIIFLQTRQQMTAIILDGQQLAQQKRQELANICQHLKVTPRFVVFLIGSNPASEIYIQRKQQAALKSVLIVSSNA